MIELVVGLGVMMLIVAGGAISISRFASRDRVLASKNELVSGLKMARNYAVSAQVPEGYSRQLDSVMVELTAEGVMTVYPVTVNFGTGTSYFSKTIKTKEVAVTPIATGELVYSVPEGKLLEYGLNNPSNSTSVRDSDYKLDIVISPVDISDGETRTVTVYSGGGFDEK